MSWVFSAHSRVEALGKDEKTLHVIATKIEHARYAYVDTANTTLRGDFIPIKKYSDANEMCLLKNQLVFINIPKTVSDYSKSTTGIKKEEIS